MAFVHDRFADLVGEHLAVGWGARLGGFVAVAEEAALEQHGGINGISQDAEIGGPDAAISARRGKVRRLPWMRWARLRAYGEL